jgi:hypothetical protein
MANKANALGAVGANANAVGAVGANANAVAIDDFDDDDIDSAWSKFCNDDPPLPPIKTIDTVTLKEAIPKCSPLNISTKTKISYLNYPIDLKKVFWAIPLIKYHEPNIGVIKKQMKFNSLTPEEVSEIVLKKAEYDYVDDYVISQVHATDGRSKFKDIRKVSIGICKKDITSYRCKRKSAFYNCFVVILRLLHNQVYKEIHVKVFNTGKMEIPGIQDATILNKVLTLLVEILTPLVILPACASSNTGAGANTDLSSAPLNFLDHKSETVMINSNFGCGYYINREKMYKLLKYKYKINSNFDPCSYPGIQCEFYYDPSLKKQHGIQPAADASANSAGANSVSHVVSKISFMVFRTGSVLIVGKCSEEMLYEIYDFLCRMFETEYDEINGTILLTKTAPVSTEEVTAYKEKPRKFRKKVILVLT